MYRGPRVSLPSHSGSWSAGRHMAVITERCIHLFELPDAARPGSCGRYAGGWPTIRFGGLEAQEISRRTPACAPLPPPPTLRRQHSHNPGRVLFAIGLTLIITTFWFRDSFHRRCLGRSSVRTGPGSFPREAVRVPRKTLTSGCVHVGSQFSPTPSPLQPCGRPSLAATSASVNLLAPIALSAVARSRRRRAGVSGCLRLRKIGPA